MVLSLVKEVFGLGTSWLKHRREKSKAKADLKMAVLNNKTRLASEKETNNSAWEMKALETSGHTLKFLSFTLFALPIIFTVVGPFFEDGNVAVRQMWENFRLVPDAWMTIYYYITGGIWGIASLKDVVPSVAAGISSAIRKK